MGLKFFNDVLEAISKGGKLLQIVEAVDLVTTDGLNNVAKLEDMFHNSPQMENCIEWIKQDPASYQMLEERYIPTYPSLDDMLKMPKHSLGWTYAKLMKTLGYKLLPYSTQIENDSDYVRYQNTLTHEIHHVVTGFSFDDCGEFGVLAVSSVQVGYPAFVAINLLGLVAEFFFTDDVDKDKLVFDYEVTRLGEQMGHTAKPLFPVKWDQGLERSLAKWREELAIKPVTEGKFSWYARPDLQAAIELHV